MSPSEFTTEAFTLLSFGLLVIFLRTYTRVTTVGLKGLKADDYLMILAAVVYTIETYLAYTVGEFWHGLANNGMTDAQRAALAPYSPEWWLRVNGSKTHVAGWTIYTFLLWIMKSAMCTFYLRLTDNLRHFKIRVHIGFVLIFVSWIAVTLSILLGCQPFEKNWQIYPDPGNFCQPALSKINIFVTVVLNVGTDLYLLSIPIPLLWQATLPKQKKIGLIVLFGAGIFVTMAGILRCVLIASDPVNGAKAAAPWGMRETFVAVVTSNIPMIYPLVRRIWGSGFLGTVRSSLSSSRSGIGASKAAARSQSVAVRLENTHKQPSSSSSRRMSRHMHNSSSAKKNPIEPAVNESQEYIYESFVGGRRVQHRHRIERLDSSGGKSDGSAADLDSGDSSAGTTPTGMGMGMGVVDVGVSGGVGRGSVPPGFIKKEVTLQITSEERSSGGHTGGGSGMAGGGTGLGTPMGMGLDLDDDAMAASDFGYHQVAFGGPHGSKSLRRAAATNTTTPKSETAVWSARDGEDSSRDSFTFITHNGKGGSPGGGAGGGGGGANMV